MDYGFHLVNWSSILNLFLWEKIAYRSLSKIFTRHISHEVMNSDWSIIRLCFIIYFILPTWSLLIIMLPWNFVSWSTWQKGEKGVNPILVPPQLCKKVVHFILVHQFNFYNCFSQKRIKWMPFRKIWVKVENFVKLKWVIFTVSE